MHVLVRVCSNARQSIVLDQCSQMDAGGHLLGILRSEPLRQWARGTESARRGTMHWGVTHTPQRVAQGSIGGSPHAGLWDGRCGAAESWTTAPEAKGTVIVRPWYLVAPPVAQATAAAAFHCVGVSTWYHWSRRCTCEAPSTPAVAPPVALIVALAHWGKKTVRCHPGNTLVIPGGGRRVKVAFLGFWPTHPPMLHLDQPTHPPCYMLPQGGGGEAGRGSQAWSTAHLGYRQKDTWK